MIWKDRIILPPNIKIIDYQIHDDGIIILFIHNIENEMWAAAVYDSKTREFLEIDAYSKKRLAYACYVDRMRLATNPELTDWIPRIK